MKTLGNPLLKRALKDERGQVLPWVALLMVLFLGMTGLTIDLSHAYVCYRELQASTDAATLAGAYAMTLSGATSTTVTNQVKAYSSLLTGAGTTSGAGANADLSLPSVTLGTTSLKCVSSSIYVDVPCTASPTGDNVIRVTQSATVPMYFIGALKALGNTSTAASITLNTTSEAAIMSGNNTAQNIAIIIDTTASMKDQDNDANCGNTELYCALQGMQVLLKSLTPCSSGSTSSNCVGAYDQVSLFTFPNLEANTASKDTTCPSSNPTIGPYSYVPKPSTTNTTWTAPTGTTQTYQVTNYMDNYSATNAANGGLSSSSALAIAAGAGSCNGLGAPGGDGTYIASAMYAAITSLQAAKNANPLSSNALILLTDGGASSSNFGSGFNTSGATYPSTVDQCTQTVAAGQYATSLGITVYTVAYGASSSTSACSTDTGSNAISPCTELQDTASSAADFYSDATAAENNGQCVSGSNPSLTLNQIFGSIANHFTAARLVPNSV
jgi:Flp pilus assembly protein TadG